VDPASPLDLTPDRFRALARDAVELVARYYESLETRPVMPRTGSAAIRALLDRDLPRQAADPTDLLDAVRDVAFDHSRHNGHPRFFGYIASPGHPVAAVADLIASALNSNVTSWRSAPAGTEIERLVVDWLRQIVGYPAGSTGLLVSGGSMANLCGLAGARAVVGGIGPDGMAATGQRMRIYATAEAHFSIRKAARLLGIGEANVRTVRTDSRLRLDVAHLEEAIDEDLRAGHRPLCVVATAGTVGAGMVDPLDAIADVAAARGLWFHVDASYGGFARLVPDVQPLFAGLERADSVALDPHKWLFAATGTGCVLYRDPAAARAAFSESADYINVIGRDEDEAFAFWDYGPELSRRFRGLGLWMLIRVAGTENLARQIGENIACAKYFESLVRASADFEMLAAVELSVFCFRYRPPGADSGLDGLNEKILLQLQRDGHSYVSNARIGGRFALRGCAVNYRTTRRDMEILLEDVRRAAATVTG
jgi:glutamate/tyrosine decarboxylase-like PLP-dependent enzyme